MDYKKFERHIEKVNLLLVDKFVDYYGGKYRGQIVNKLNNVEYIFQTDPDYEYFIIKRVPQFFSELEKNNIAENFYRYNKIENEVFENAQNALIQYISLYFKELNLSDEVVGNNLCLFTDSSFDGSYIDSFGSKSLALLMRDDVSYTIKESIIKDQKEFLTIASRYNITYEMMISFKNKVDEFIKFRDMLKEGYCVEVVERSQLGKNIKYKIEKNIGEKVDVRDLLGFFFKKELCALSWANSKNERVKNGCIIKVPLVLMRCFSKDFADETLIHELIHAIESGENVGIMNEENNRILNEIRTQMLAKKITKQLHDEGVYIFEDSLNFPIDEEKCIYEYMFPLVESFFARHDKIISKCAIENDSKLLIESFGEAWNKFSKRVDEMFDFMIKRWQFGYYEEEFCDEECKRLIVEMNKNCDKLKNKR